MSQRILLVHNAYQYRGGEDSVVESETALLRDRGHEVHFLGRDNSLVQTMSRLRLAKETVWSKSAYDEVLKTIRQFKPDLVHVHNTMPLLSPAVYWAAAAEGAPVVQTLHNFRLMCPQAMFLREEKVCEDCLGKVPWRGVVRKCYRGSAAQTAVLAASVQFHRFIGTWRTRVDRYIALNEFCRQKFIEGGLPVDRVVVKPNFVEAPAPDEGLRKGLLYVGRLSVEKGIETMAEAARLVPALELDVVGTGPREDAIAGVPGCRLVGSEPAAAVLARMRGAQALVLPSVWYENFPRTLVEAYASGLPVIASRIGALAELVQDGLTGLLFNSGDAADLAEKMRWAIANPARMADMGRAARQQYERLYTPDINYRQLMAIYDDASGARTSQERRHGRTA